MRAKKEIIAILNNAIVEHFNTVTWFNVICSTNLSKEERKWAKNNTGYAVRDYTQVTAEGTR